MRFRNRNFLSVWFGKLEVSNVRFLDLGFLKLFPWARRRPSRTTPFQRFANDSKAELSPHLHARCRKAPVPGSLHVRLGIERRDILRFFFHLFDDPQKVVRGFNPRYRIPEELQFPNIPCNRPLCQRLELACQGPVIWALCGTLETVQRMSS